MKKKKIKEIWKRFKEEKKYTSREYLVSILAGLAFGMLICEALVEDIYDKRYVLIPNTDQVQQRCVVPSNLEFKLEYLGDYKRKPYFIMNYKGKSYLFKENEKQEPYFQKYKIKPAQPAELIPLK